MRGGRYGGSALVWLLLLTYASLYPFAPMRAPSAETVRGVFTLARHVIRSDVVFNVAAYVPLGTLLCLYFRSAGARPGIAKAPDRATYPHMEGPSSSSGRVSAVVDLVANTSGALLGALCSSIRYRWSTSGARCASAP